MKCRHLVFILCFNFLIHAENLEFNAPGEGEAEETSNEDQKYQQANENEERFSRRLDNENKQILRRRISVNNFDRKRLGRTKAENIRRNFLEEDREEKGGRSENDENFDNFIKNSFTNVSPGCRRLKSRGNYIKMKRELRRQMFRRMLDRRNREDKRKMENRREKEKHVRNVGDDREVRKYKNKNNPIKSRADTNVPLHVMPAFEQVADTVKKFLTDSQKYTKEKLTPDIKKHRHENLYKIWADDEGRMFLEPSEQGQRSLNQVLLNPGENKPLKLTSDDGKVREKKEVSGNQFLEDFKNWESKLWNEKVLSVGDTITKDRRSVEPLKNKENDVKKMEKNDADKDDTDKSAGYFIPDAEIKKDVENLFKGPGLSQVKERPEYEEEYDEIEEYNDDKIGKRESEQHLDEWLKYVDNKDKSGVGLVEKQTKKEEKKQAEAVSKQKRRKKRSVGTDNDELLNSFGSEMEGEGNNANVVKKSEAVWEPNAQDEQQEQDANEDSNGRKDSDESSLVKRETKRRTTGHVTEFNSKKLHKSKNLKPGDVESGKVKEGTKKDEVKRKTTDTKKKPDNYKYENVVVKHSVDENKDKTVNEEKRNDEVKGKSDKVKGKSVEVDEREKKQVLEKNKQDLETKKFEEASKDVRGTDENKIEAEKKTEVVSKNEKRSVGKEVWQHSNPQGDKGKLERQQPVKRTDWVKESPEMTKIRTEEELRSLGNKNSPKFAEGYRDRESFLNYLQEHNLISSEEASALSIKEDSTRDEEKMLSPEADAIEQRQKEMDDLRSGRPGYEVVDNVYNKVRKCEKMNEYIGQYLRVDRVEYHIPQCGIKYDPSIAMRIENIMKSLIGQLEQVAEEVVRQKSCMKLSKDLKHFLHTLLRVPQTYYDQEQVIKDIYNERKHKCFNNALEKEKELLKLIEEYDKLKPEEKRRLCHVKKFLLEKLKDANLQEELSGSEVDLDTSNEVITIIPSLFNSLQHTGPNGRIIDPGIEHVPAEPALTGDVNKYNPESSDLNKNLVDKISADNVKREQKDYSNELMKDSKSQLSGENQKMGQTEYRSEESNDKTDQNQNQLVKESDRDSEIQNYRSEKESSDNMAEDISDDSDRVYEQDSVDEHVNDFEHIKNRRSELNHLSGPSLHINKRKYEWNRKSEKPVAEISGGPRNKLRRYKREIDEVPYGEWYDRKLRSINTKENYFSSLLNNFNVDYDLKLDQVNRNVFDKLAEEDQVKEWLNTPPVRRKINQLIENLNYDSVKRFRNQV